MLMRSVKKLKDKVKKWLKGRREQIKTREKIQRHPMARMKKKKNYKEKRTEIIIH